MPQVLAEPQWLLAAKTRTNLPLRGRVTILCLLVSPLLVTVLRALPHPNTPAGSSALSCSPQLLEAVWRTRGGLGRAAGVAAWGLALAAMLRGAARFSSDYF